jgi:[ribosomal protein S5]-alanine N-acetyltransferase
MLKDGDPFEPIETPRILLRCVDLGDADATSRLMTPAVSQWLASWHMPYSPLMAMDLIAAARNSAFNGGGLPFAVIEKESGSFMGWTTVNRDPENGRCGSFGYWLGEPFQKQGYMGEIAPFALTAGFELLSLDVIEAGAQPENRASLAVMRGCGMQPAGERMVYASTRDRHELCHFYEIRRPPRHG